MASAGGRELTADDDPWRVSAFISALMELVLSVLLLLGATIAFITAQLVKFFGLEPPCTYIGCSHNLLADSSKRRRHAVCRFHHLKEDCDCCPDCGASWGYAKLHSEEFSSTNDDTDGCLLPDREHSRDLSALTSDLDVRDHHVVDEDPHGSYDSALQLGQKRPCLCFASSSRIYRKPGRPKYAKLEASIFGCNGTAEEERVPLFSMRSVSACSSHSDAEDHSEMSSTSTGNQKKPISQKEKCLQKETLADGDASIHSSEGVSRNSEDEHHYMLLEGEDEEIYEAPFCNSFESISRDPKGEHCYMLLQGEGEDIPEGEPFYIPLQHTHRVCLSMEDRVYPSYNGGAHNNGPKAFNYNYPLQQPESPQTPRRGRRRCCVCCCWSLLVFFLLLCIGAVLVYFLMKPKAPKYTVDQATITQFNLTSKNHLNSDIKFVITAHNPNKYFEFFFSDVNFVSSYEDAEIGQGSIAAFQQSHKSTLNLPLRVQGRDVALRGSVASDLKKGLSKKSTLELKLKAKTHIKIKVGSLKSWKQKVKLTCDISMAAPTKPGKGQILSSKCKLKKP